MNTHAHLTASPVSARPRDGGGSPVYAPATNSPQTARATKRSAVQLAASSLAAFLFTAPLSAETFNLSDSPALYGVASDAKRDRIDLTKEGEARYHLTYHNNEAKHSTGGNYSATHGTLVVRFYVEIGDAETVYVTPAEPWVSIPPQLDIEDGDTGLFLIVLPMY